MSKQVVKTPLPETVEEALKYAQKNGRIVPWELYGEHIPLTCENHPDLRWSTKNIGGIGSRSIFFSSAWGVKPTEPMPVECSCKARSLKVVVPDDWKEKVIPLQIIKCCDCDEEIMEENQFSSGNMVCCRCYEIAGAFGGKIKDEVKAVMVEKGFSTEFGQRFESERKARRIVVRRKLELVGE